MGRRDLAPANICGAINIRGVSGIIRAIVKKAALEQGERESHATTADYGTGIQFTLVYPVPTAEFRQRRKCLVTRKSHA